MEDLQFECKGMKSGEKFPIRNTGRGEDISPGFLLRNLSPKAKTLAITLEDITHPIFKNFTHWLIWNIPAGEQIGEAISRGKFVPGVGNARQGLGYGLYRYAGPKPPQGKRHLYRFTVYALDREIDLKFPHTKRNFIKTAKAYMLQRGSMVYEFE